MEKSDFGKIVGNGAKQDAMSELLFDIRDLLRIIAGVEAPKPEVIEKATPAEPTKAPEKPPEKSKPVEEDPLLDTGSSKPKTSQKALKSNKKPIKNRRRR